MRVIWNLWCDKTTEAGQDEVYILTALRTSDGRYYTARLPGPGDHWNFNDGNAPRNHNGILLADIDLPVGQSAKLVCVIMEQDGGTSKPWSDIAVGILAAIPTGVTQIAAGVIGFLGQFINFEDSDDFIGSFEVTVTNSSSGYQSIWKQLERSSEIPNGGGPGTFGFRFNGDGSNYFGWGIVA